MKEREMEKDLLMLAKIVADLAMSCAMSAPPARRKLILEIREEAIKIAVKMEDAGVIV